MSFDYTTLITDRTQSDVSARNAKGTYNAEDLNRVTAALDDLWQRFLSAGYTLPRYKKIEIEHKVSPAPEPEPESRLPEGYTELEYIGSTGTQYIDTGFKANQNTRFVMSGYNESTGREWIYGAWNATNSGAFGYLSYNKYFVYGSQQVTTNALPAGAFTLDHNKNTFILNGATASASAATFTGNYSLYLFALNNAGGVSSGKFIGKVYSCQIYDNGTLVRDFVPCKNPDGAVGLYDIVDGVFYGNAGTGVFAAGPATKIVELEYIESSGTQYINTDVIGASGIEAEMDFSSDDVSGTPYVLGSRKDSNTRAYWLMYSNGFGYGYISLNNSGVTATVGKRYMVVSKLLPGSQSLSIDGTVIASGTNATSFTTNYSLALLANNYAGNVMDFAKAKLYSCKIYDNGLLVRDYVPAKTIEGEIGLYDRVFKKFYRNAGTGVFAAGPEMKRDDFTELKYVESSGTQYDPYLWYDIDIPQETQMRQYLTNVNEVRTAVAMLATTPDTPESMELLTWAKANHIEQILVDIEALLTAMACIYIKSGSAWAYSGAAGFYFMN